MPKTTSKPIIDPPKEELQKLRQLLSEWEALTKEHKAYQSLFEESKADVDDFANSGNLRDIDAVSSMVARQAQSSLVTQRLEKINESRDATNHSLTEECVVVGRLLIGELYNLQNGLVEKAAKDLQPHFETLQECRSKAFQSKAARAVDSRINALNVESLRWNNEADQIAALLLEKGPQIFDEVAKVRKELGGEIPSASELRG